MAGDGGAAGAELQGAIAAAAAEEEKGTGVAQGAEAADGAQGAEGGKGVEGGKEAAGATPPLPHLKGPASELWPGWAACRDGAPGIPPCP